MIFAFLFGLSMDYEVFMLTPHARGLRRDRLHRQGDRARPRPHRQARHQRRADPRCSPSSCSPRAPGYEIKPLAIGLAAGIILDATVIRALLVPALMRLFGDANWWMPGWTRTVLRIPDREPVPQVAAESA